MPEEPILISEITLHALIGTPLLNDRVRQMVVATAHAIAERQGVTIARINTQPDELTIQVYGEEIIALGLITELRQLTNNWYQHQFDADTLWGP